jgi:hypothetical protein
MQLHRLCGAELLYNEMTSLNRNTDMVDIVTNSLQLDNTWLFEL